MKKQIEDMIPRAIEVAKKIIASNEKDISKQYNGYISSFGASIITSGLLPAVSFFTSDKANTEEERELIPIAIYYIAIEDNNIPKKDNPKILLKYLVKNKNSIDKHKPKIIDAAIALKLAIRTFNLVDKKNLK